MHLILGGFIMKRIYLLWFNIGDNSKFNTEKIIDIMHLGDCFIVHADDEDNALETLKKFYRRSGTEERYVELFDEIEIDELGTSSYTGERWSDVIFKYELGFMNYGPAQMEPMGA